ncbi:hypothetical protein [Bacillus sp. Brlt_9]
MIKFICNACKEENKVEKLETTETGEWVIACECGDREIIELNSFQPVSKK